MKKLNLHKLRAGLTRLVRIATSAPAPAGDRLELWLPPRWPEQPSDVRWRLTPIRGEVLRGHVNDLGQLPDQARAARAHVWTSASESVLVRVNLPTRSRAKILQALPYALEDQLLDPPDSLHFAFQTAPDGGLAVAVTAHTRLRGWLSALKSAGLRPSTLAPVSLALPIVAGSWTVAFTGSEIVWRSSTYSGAGCLTQSDLPRLLMSAIRDALTDGAPPERLVFVGAPADTDIESWGKGLTVPFEIDSQHAVDDLPFVPPPINLLQGDYAVSGEWRELARPYLPAAALLLLWLAGGMVSNVAEWAWLQQRHWAIQNEMKKLLLTSFAETQTVIDPVQQMQRSVEQLLLRHGVQTTGDLLPLLSRVAPALPRDGRVRLQSLSYADKSLTLNLTTSDEPSLESLKRVLASNRVEVDVQNVNRRANQIEARLRVRAKG